MPQEKANLPALSFFGPAPPLPEKFIEKISLPVPLTRPRQRELAQIIRHQLRFSKGFADAVTPIATARVRPAAIEKAAEGLWLVLDQLLAAGPIGAELADAEQEKTRRRQAAAEAEARQFVASQINRHLRSENDISGDDGFTVEERSQFEAMRGASSENADAPQVVGRLSVEGIAGILLELIRACRDVERGLDVAHADKLYRKVEPWNRLVWALADFYERVTSKKPSVSNSATDFDRHQPFADFVLSIQVQFPDNFRGVSQADGSIGSPSAAFVQAIRRALKAR
jgi:hypothetical protein